MLTIDDLLKYINIEGPARVIRWVNDGCQVLFDGDADELYVIDEDWMNTEIRFMFANADGKLVIEVA